MIAMVAFICRAARWRTLAGWLLLALLGASPLPGSAAVIHLYPGNSFESAAESLSPGDTLVVHAGTYAGTGRVAIGQVLRKLLVEFFEHVGLEHGESFVAR